MQDVLQRIIDESRPLVKDGQVASYIPELLKADKNNLGIYVVTKDGEFGAGDYNQVFTMQSVSKVITLLCCMIDNDNDAISKKVSFEPTNDGFNSIVTLETKNKNRPLNPLINSGAILCSSLVKGQSKSEKFERILEFAKIITGNAELKVNADVYLSEKDTGSRNRALAYFMHSTGIMEGDVEDNLDVYFRTCSIEVTCKELANIAFCLANDGTINGVELFPRSLAKSVKAIMSMCGMYNESGEMAVNVGLPSKSGVGGGILTVVPNKMGIGVFGPSLNENGSSIGGIEVLKKLSHELDLSIY